MTVGAGAKEAEMFKSGNLRFAVTRLSGAMIVVFALVGCRTSKSSPAPEAVGIGFDLADDPRVARGSIVTQPRGREEAFLPFVAGSSSRWAGPCQKEPGGGLVQFSFTTNGGGRVEAMPGSAAATARARCMAAQVSATPGEPLLPDTHVTVQISLREAR